MVQNFSNTILLKNRTKSINAVLISSMNFLSFIFFSSLMAAFISAWRSFNNFENDMFNGCVSLIDVCD